MPHRRLVTLAGLAVTGVLALGGCADAPSGTAGSPVPASPTAAPGPQDQARQDQAPCTQRLRSGGGGPSAMALTPEAQAEIERLRALTPEQQAAEGRASAARDPQLTARLAEVRSHVERATRPCRDR